MKRSVDDRREARIRRRAARRPARGCRASSLCGIADRSRPSRSRCTWRRYRRALADRCRIACASSLQRVGAASDSPSARYGPSGKRKRLRETETVAPLKTMIADEPRAHFVARLRRADQRADEVVIRRRLVDEAPARRASPRSRPASRARSDAETRLPARPCPSARAKPAPMRRAFRATRRNARRSLRRCECRRRYSRAAPPTSARAPTAYTRNVSRAPRHVVRIAAAREHDAAPRAHFMHHAFDLDPRARHAIRLAQDRRRPSPACADRRRDPPPTSAGARRAHCRSRDASNGR